MARALISTCLLCPAHVDTIKTAPEQRADDTALYTIKLMIMIMIKLMKIMIKMMMLGSLQTRDARHGQAGEVPLGAPGPAQRRQLPLPLAQVHLRVVPPRRHGLRRGAGGHRAPDLRLQGRQAGGI